MIIIGVGKPTPYKEDIKMSRYTLEHYYEVVPYDKDEVESSLLSLADCDNDFNGENGPEYLWEEAEGFESNAKYCMSIAKNETATVKIVKSFLIIVLF